MWFCQRSTAAKIRSRNEWRKEEVKKIKSDTSVDICLCLEKNIYQDYNANERTMICCSFARWYIADSKFEDERIFNNKTKKIRVRCIVRNVNTISKGIATANEITSLICVESNNNNNNNNNNETRQIIIISRVDETREENVALIVLMLSLYIETTVSSDFRRIFHEFPRVI